MMRSLNIGHWVALVSMAALVASCGSTRETAWDTTSQNPYELDDAARARVAELMATAEAAWANRGDQAQAKAAIDAWTMAAEIDPKNVEALSVLNASAVPALYWRASNLGRWAVLESFATLLSYKDEIREVMDFCLDQNPLYFYQGPDRYFGVFYAKAPGFAGGDMKKSAAHFNVAIDAHPNYYGTRILMAEEWAIKEDNRPLFEELINYVLNGDPNAIPELVPESTCEQRKAAKLMAEIDDTF